MIALALSVLGASLLGSTHCAGMCGGFVCFYAGDGERGRRLAHVAYNGGRLVSYVLLGAVAGALGQGLDHAGALAGVTRTATLAAGVFITAWGIARLVASLRPAHAIVPTRATPPGVAARLAGAAMARARQAPPWARALTLGLLTTLLPCGWLYAFVATAAGTGAPLLGALVMAAFWVGTLPALAAVALVARGALGPVARRLPLVTSAVLVVVGLLTLGQRLAPGHAGTLHAGRAVAPTATAAHACHPGM